LRAKNDVVLDRVLPGVFLATYHELLIFALILLAPALWAQTSAPPAIRVNVNLVSIPARVTDKQGHDATGLTAADFSVAEDGRQQQIAFFDADQQPLSLTVLVDSSTSMNSDAKLQITQAALDRIISASRTDDEISLIKFTDHIESFQRLTSAQRLMVVGDNGPSSSGGTALYDAVASAFCHLRTDKNLRQAIVVITDGADQHSRIGLEKLIPLVRASRAQLFMIGLYTGAKHEIYRQGDKTVTLVTGREIDNPFVVFDRLAKESGAEAFFPTSSKGLEQALQAVSNILRAQYTLAYYPDRTSKGFRKIQVKVKTKGLKVQTRRGVGLDAGIEEIGFDDRTCEINAERYPYPYESRLSKKESTNIYAEDFSDPRSGWPNRLGSRYITRAYELSNDEAKARMGETLVTAGPIGEGALAAYGPWWNEFRASVELDAGWSKMHAPVPSLKPRSPDQALSSSSAGLIFRVTDRGFYAFLVSTSSKAYESDELSFKLVRGNYVNALETVIIPWTRLPDREPTQRLATGTKLSVECIGSKIALFIDDQQVAKVQDSNFSEGYVGFVLFGKGRVSFRNLRVEGDR
jgi:Ca-activated chloride channel family protein